MPMLGDILAAARGSAPELAVWLEKSRPDLAVRLQAAAALEGVTPSTYLRIAVADYGRLASEEEWAGMTSRLREAGDPGSACLLAMLEWRLATVPTLSPAGDS